MHEVEHRKDALEAFIHTFIAEPELEQRFMGLINDYARSYHLKESKLLVERMKEGELFKDEFSIEIDSDSNSLKITKPNEKD